MKLYEKTARELHSMLTKKDITCKELTSAFIDRIESVDNKIESYITTTFEMAVKTAEIVDEKIARGEKISSLEGVPMAIKDNICTKGIKTTCASKMLENFVPPYDATVVQKIKKNNIPILGKLNMDEFAMGSSTENSYFKKTKNPHDLDRVPGGSSGGSAACVAAHEAVFSLGSDTGGSIRQPASLCGIVGLKPTYGAVSRYGLVAFASSLDQIGPLTKNVSDCALVMNLIYGYDEMDSTSSCREYGDFTKNLSEDIKGLKIALPKEYFSEGISDDVRESVLKSADIFRRLGAVVDEVSLPFAEYALPAYYIIASAEASSNLSRYDGVKYGYRTPDFSDLHDLYFNTRSEGFGNEVKKRILLGTYVLSSGYYDAYYKKAQKMRVAIKHELDKILGKYDVILTPTTSSTAFKFGEKTQDPISMYMQDVCTVFVNIAGVPAISVPCGFDKSNLPIGLQLIGGSFCENKLINAAYAYEQASDIKFGGIGHEL